MDFQNMMKNNNRLYIIVWFITMFLIGCTKVNLKGTNQMESVIALLSDKNRCDEAYEKIISLEKEAIPLLIKNASNNSPYEGTIIYEPTSSFVIDKPTVGVVSLYLIECILKDRIRPHHTPLIITINDKFPYKDENKLPRTKDNNLKKAKSYYQLWWGKVKHKNIKEIRKTSPLEDTDLRWF